MELILKIFKCDICGEEYGGQKKDNTRELNIPRYDGFLERWLSDEYIICNACFENMKKYCREHKGGKK